MTMSYCQPTLLFVVILFGSVACSQDLGVSPDIDLGSDQQLDNDASKDMPQRKEPGEACFGPSECGSNLCIGSGSGFECMVTCESSYALCEGGSVCLPLNGRPESICYTGGRVPKGGPCQTNIDCLSGHLCIGAETAFYCTAACMEPEDCPSGSTCLKLASGAAVCARNLGKICDTGAECEEDLICTTDDVDFAAAFYPGICTTPECDGCPIDSACVLLAGAARPVCLPGCVDDSDCRFIRGWRCRGHELCAGTPEEGACEVGIANKTICVPPEVP